MEHIMPRKNVIGRFALLNSAPKEDDERFVPTVDHLNEQHECGIFFDDDYNYLKHLRNSGRAELIPLDKPKAQPAASTTDVFSPPPLPLKVLYGELMDKKEQKRIERLENEIEGVIEEVSATADPEFDILDDNFIDLAGGAADPAFDFRDNEPIEDEESGDEEGQIDYTCGARYEYSGNMEDMMDEEDEEEKLEAGGGNRRDLDDQFDKMLEANYNVDQMGELDVEQEGMCGVLEPSDPHIKELIFSRKRRNKYDRKDAVDWIKERVNEADERGDDPTYEKEEVQEIEVEESTRKKLRWDCESFATLATNIYNHPTRIAAEGGLSKRSLRLLNKKNKEDELAAQQDAEDEKDDEDMDDDDCESFISTVSHFRPKGETPEERKARREAVKAERKIRRMEKKINKIGFQEEFQRIHNAKVGVVKAKKMI